MDEKTLELEQVILRGRIPGMRRAWETVKPRFCRQTKIKIQLDRYSRQWYTFCRTVTQIRKMQRKIP